MNWVTCNPLRTIGMPYLNYVKPDQMFRQIEQIREADIVLFPEYWQVNSLAYGLKKMLFPSLASYHLGHDKVEMTRVMTTLCPKHVPYTEIYAATAENSQRVMDSLPLPFVAKEIKNSMGQGVFLISKREEWEAYAARNEIWYVQEYLPVDRDLRVCVVGGEVVGAYWRLGENGSFLHNVAQGGVVSFEHIPIHALHLVLHVANQLGIDHAGFDLMLIDDHPYIIEFNILFGNQALIQRGIRVEEAIEKHVKSLLEPTFPRSPFTPQNGNQGKIIS